MDNLHTHLGVSPIHPFLSSKYLQKTIFKKVGFVMKERLTNNSQANSKKQNEFSNMNKSMNMDDVVKNMTPAVASLVPLLTKTHKLVEPQIIQLGDTIISTFSKCIQQSMNVQNTVEAREKFLNSATQFMKPIAELILNLDISKDNPDSLWNYHKYKKNLENFFWAFPYNVSTSELSSIINEVKSEKEFDEYMNELFDNRRLSLMFGEITNELIEPQKMIFEQSIFSFYNGNYALTSMGIIALIDYSLSFFIKDKEVTARYNIFEPILKEFDNISVNELNMHLVISLTILNSNINRIFEKISFNNQKINSNKTIRRHPSQHGFDFSNERIDCIMLINTLYNVLNLRPYLIEYQDKLVYKYKNGNRYKKFYIS